MHLATVYIAVLIGVCQCYAIDGFFGGFDSSLQGCFPIDRATCNPQDCNFGYEPAKTLFASRGCPVCVCYPCKPLHCDLRDGLCFERTSAEECPLRCVSCRRPGGIFGDWNKK